MVFVTEDQEDWVTLTTFLLEQQQIAALLNGGEPPSKCGRILLPHDCFCSVIHLNLSCSSPFPEIFPLSHSMLESKSHLREEGKDRTKITLQCGTPVYRLQLCFFFFFLSHFVFPRRHTTRRVCQSFVSCLRS